MGKVITNFRYSWVLLSVSALALLQSGSVFAEVAVQIVDNNSAQRTAAAAQVKNEADLNLISAKSAVASAQKDYDTAKKTYDKDVDNLNKTASKAGVSAPAANDPNACQTLKRNLDTAQKDATKVKDGTRYFMLADAMSGLDCDGVSKHKGELDKTGAALKDAKKALAVATGKDTQAGQDALDTIQNSTTTGSMQAEGGTKAVTIKTGASQAPLKMGDNLTSQLKTDSRFGQIGNQFYLKNTDIDVGGASGLNDTAKALAPLGYTYVPPTSSAGIRDGSGQVLPARNSDGSYTFDYKGSGQQISVTVSNSATSSVDNRNTVFTDAQITAVGTAPGSGANLDDKLGVTDNGRIITVPNVKSDTKLPDGAHVDMSGNIILNGRYLGNINDPQPKK